MNSQIHTKLVKTNPVVQSKSFSSLVRQGFSFRSIEALVHSSDPKFRVLCITSACWDLLWWGRTFNFILALQNVEFKTNPHPNSKSLEKQVNSEIAEGRERLHTTAKAITILFTSLFFFRPPPSKQEINKETTKF